MSKIDVRIYSEEEQVVAGYIYVGNTRVGFSGKAGRCDRTDGYWATRPEGYWPRPTPEQFEEAMHIADYEQWSDWVPKRIT